MSEPDFKTIAKEIAKFRNVYPYPTCYPKLLLEMIEEALKESYLQGRKSVVWPTREEFLEAAWDKERDNFTYSDQLYDWLRARVEELNKIDESGEG